VVVDDHVQVVEADRHRVEVVAALDGVTPEHLPAAALSDPPKLLHVHVEQLTGPVPLVADDGASGPVDPAQTRQALAPKDPVDRGSGTPQRIGETMRTVQRGKSGGHDLCDLVVVEAMRTAPRRRRAVLEA
jgi:hypothetical protein